MQIGIQKASEIAEMTPQNLRYLIKRGLGPDCETIVGRRVFKEEDVRKWYKKYSETRSKK